MLHCTVLQTAVDLFTPLVLCPLSLPISLPPVCSSIVGAGARLADEHGSGWQMPGVSVDALHQLMTDVRASLGWQHFITLSCSSPHWIHQSAWQTLRPTPSHHPHCIIPTASSPFPLATPIHTHTCMHPHTHFCIHQSSVITSDSHHTGNQWITC